MTVKKRLILNVILTVAGIALILAASIFSNLEIRRSVLVLTGKSTPLQVKTLELQQMVEKISADLMRLGLSGSEKEVEAISGAIEGHVKIMEGINSEIQSLSAQTSKSDIEVFRSILKSVMQTVNRKIQSISLFRTETSNVNAAFKQVEGALTAIKDNIAKLNLNAKGVVTAAQESSAGLNSTIKKLLTIQLILKDIRIAITEIDTIKNKYKLNPLKERLGAFSGSVQNISYVRGEPDIIRESKDLAVKICDQIVKDGSGLIAARAASFSDGGADGYASVKSGIAGSLDSISSRITEVIDGFEIKILKEKANMDNSRSFESAAETIAEVGNAINVDIKELNSGVRLVMLAQSAQELDNTVSAVGRTKEDIIKNMRRLRTGLKQARHDNMLKNSDIMIQSMDSVGASIDRIIRAKKDVVISDTAMQKSMEDIKEVSAKQSGEGERQVRSISQKQQDVVKNVGRTVSVSMTFMAVASLVVLALVTVWNSRTIISIIKPLKATEEMIEAIEKGDLTKKMEVDGNDEIAHMCRSFNNLVDRLHDTISHISDKANIISRHAEIISGTVEGQVAFSTQLSVSVSEMSATMDELSASSTQIADHSGSVVEIAEGSLKKTMEGASSVETVMMKMDEINRDNENSLSVINDLGLKSKEITKIMSIINKIADQTKLIAFNAALEASSAGEAGKRFGVVAVEIRRLADNVMESTGEIETKIREILDAVSNLGVASEKGVKGIVEGLEYSGETVEKMIEIANGVQSNTDAAKQIFFSTQQQKTASEHVSAALKEIVEGASRTSDSIREVNSISKELAALSDDLKGLVEKFTLRC